MPNSMLGAARSSASGAGGGDRPARGPVEVRELVRWAECREISVRGEFDSSACPRVGKALADTVGAGFPCVILDLSECEFLDARALSLIAMIRAQLEHQRQEFILSPPHGGQAARLLQVAGMTGPSAPEEGRAAQAPGAAHAGDGRQAAAEAGAPIRV